MMKWMFMSLNGLLLYVMKKVGKFWFFFGCLIWGLVVFGSVFYCFVCFLYIFVGIGNGVVVGEYCY